MIREGFVQTGLLAGKAGEIIAAAAEHLRYSQPTISHHLKTLVEAGFLHREKRGTWAYYSLVPGALEGVASLITTV